MYTGFHFIDAESSLRTKKDRKKIEKSWVIKIELIE